MRAVRPPRCLFSLDGDRSLSSQPTPAAPPRYTGVTRLPATTETRPGLPDSA